MAEFINLNNFKIIALNVNSLISLSKRSELSLFLRKNNPHVLLLSETKLNKCHKVVFNGYNLVRTDRGYGAGGGTAILIKNSIKFDLVSTSYLSDSLESTAIKLRTVENTNIYLFSIYVNNPRHEELSKDLSNILRSIPSNNLFIIGGDFNARHVSWRNRTNNYNGLALRSWLDCYNQLLNHVSTLEPTYQTERRSSFIDYFIVHKQIKVNYPFIAEKLLSILDFDSDHMAVELIVQDKINIERKEFMYRRNYKETDWIAFSLQSNSLVSQINLDINRSLNISEINNSVSRLTGAITESIERVVPLQKVNPTCNLVLPALTIKTIRYKNYLRRKLKQNPLSSDNLLIKSQISNLKIMIKSQIDTLKQNKLKHSLKILKKDQNVFKNIDKLTQRKPFFDIPDLYDGPSAPSIRIPIDKLNCLGKHFEQVHKSNLAMGDQTFTNRINNIISSKYKINDLLVVPQLSDFSDELPSDGSKPGPTISGLSTIITPDDIRSVIKRLKPKKSTGFDSISNHILKKLPSVFCDKMTIIANNCFNTGYFPQIWKVAKVLAFPKVGKDTYFPKSYRPISLLSCVSKVMESVIKYRVNEIIFKFNIIPRFQYGFRDEHATFHLLFKFSSDITNALNDDKYTVAVFLDIEKAFDCVWIEGLIYKLQNKYKFPDYLNKLIYNYLVNRTFKVANRDSVSEEFEIAAGTAQGSVLGPYLFNLYLADITTSPDCKIAMFADDTVVYSSHRDAKVAARQVNMYLSELMKYYNMWKIKVNIEKTEAVLFRRPAYKKKIPDIEIKLGNYKIPIKKSVKYLGVTFTNLFKFNNHVNCTLNKSQIALSKLRVILSPHREASIEIKLLIYKQLIRPILFYAFPIWFNVSKGQINSLCVFERKCLRRCINFKGPKFNNNKYISNVNLYTEAKMKPLIDQMMIFSIKQLEKLESHVNPEISEIVRNVDTNIINLNRYKPPLYILLANESNLIFENQETQKVIFYDTINRNYPPRN